MDKDKYRDKREHKRFDTSDDSWASIDGSGRTSIKNISMSGMCLVITRPLDTESLHAIDIFSPDGSKITVKARVIWSSFLGVSSVNSDISYYETGLSFFDMDNNSKNALEKFIFRLA